MIIFFALGAFVLISADVTPSKDSKVIVIEEHKGKKLSQSEVKVESGTRPIVGAPKDRLPMAYSAWEKACEQWENKLKRYNGQNLIYSDCGDPQVVEQKHQSEKWYSYKSSGTYKIKVLPN